MKPSLSSGLRIMRQVKTAVRQGYAWPGGYAFVGVATDGACLCHRCLKSEFKLIARATLSGDRSGWSVIGVQTAETMEESETCAHCNGDVAA